MVTSKQRRTEPTSANGNIETATWFLQRPALVLLVITAVVYYRLLSAGFVAFDDDIHVYANSLLNPPSLQSVARFWQKPYEELYVPLAYTIYATVAHFAQVKTHIDSSIGHVVNLDPTAFHIASLAFHLLNVLLCYHLVMRLTRRTATALVASLVFALHPLQVESLGWISELRGLASGCFALLALNLFVLWRQRTDTSHRGRALLPASALLLLFAMLCKPSAAAVPIVALAIDRVVLGISWRKATAVAASAAAITIPFVLITRSVQAIPAAVQSQWWQRPFIAGDALAFYLFKVVAPVNLCVDYGRTPRLVMSHAWGYLAWVVPVCLLIVCYRYREQRPFTWLGALMFVAFLLPVLGLVPFTYQAYSTVADRYAYLALLGVGLVVADTLEHLNQQKLFARVVTVALAALALFSFQQSRYWCDSSDLLRHTIDVNPNAAFAYNNLGDTELANGELSAALSDYSAAIERDPTRVKAHINLAEVYSALNQPAEAEAVISKAVAMPGMTADDYSNLGIVLMKMSQPERALQALSTATNMGPDSPTHLYNHANALAAVGQFDKAEEAFRRCISLAPTLADAHTGLGIVLAETRRLSEALAEFRIALRLRPDDPAARDNFNRAEELMATQKQ